MKKCIWGALMIALLLYGLALPAYASGGSITVNYNNGGSISVISAVKAEGNVIYVEDDSKVEILATPDDGYEIRGVYLNDQSMNISGSGAKTIMVAPNGGSVFLRITFVKSQVADAIPDTPPADPPDDKEPAPSSAPPEVPVSPPPSPSVNTEPPPSNPPAPVPEASVSTQPTDTPQNPEKNDHSEHVEPTPGSEDDATNIQIEWPAASQTTISSEISNGGVGSLTTGNIGNALSAEERTTILIIGASVILAAAITVLIIRKGRNE